MDHMQALSPIGSNQQAEIPLTPQACETEDYKTTFIALPCDLSQEPGSFFSHPQYHATGNLFWPDAWHGEVKDEAFEMYGLQPGLTRVRPESLTAYFVIYDIHMLDHLSYFPPCPVMTRISSTAGRASMGLVDVILGTRRAGSCS